MSINGCQENNYSNHCSIQNSSDQNPTKFSKIIFLKYIGNSSKTHLIEKDIIYSKNKTIVQKNKRKKNIYYVKTNTEQLNFFKKQLYDVATNIHMDSSNPTDFEKDLTRLNVFLNEKKISGQHEIRQENETDEARIERINHSAKTALSERYTYQGFLNLACFTNQSSFFDNCKIIHLISSKLKKSNDSNFVPHMIAQNIHISDKDKEIIIKVYAEYKIQLNNHNKYGYCAGMTIFKLPEEELKMNWNHVDKLKEQYPLNPIPLSEIAPNMTINNYISAIYETQKKASYEVARMASWKNCRFN